jgi:uncharacterized protein (TIRG00374 family)
MMRQRLALGLLLGFVVVVALTLAGDIRRVAREIAGFPIGWVPLILGCTLFNYLLRFFKWHYYLGLVGAGSISRLESARIFVAGFPLAVTPGKVGEALKGAWLQRKTGTPLPKGLSVVLAERISDGLAVLALSTFGVLAYPRYWPVFTAVLIGLLGIILISQIRPLAVKLIELAGRLPILDRMAEALWELYQGAQVLFSPKATMVAVGLGTVAWLGEGVAMYLVLLGLGIPPSLGTLGVAVFVLAFSTVVGAISALPGGLVAAEGSIAGMLALTLALPASTSASATLLIRFATLWFGVGLGLVVWAVSKELVTLELAEPDSTEIPPNALTKR